MNSRNRLWRWGSVLIALLALSDCATHNAILRQARVLYANGDYDKSCQILNKALEKRPHDFEMKTLLYRAKLNSYYYHLALAREKVNTKQHAVANQEYQAALSIFPDNIRLREEFEAFNRSKEKQEQKVERKSTIQAPVQLDVKREQKITLNLKNTPITNIFKSLGKIFNINFIFDKDFRDFVHSLEVDNKTFQEVLRILCMVANADYRILDRSTILVYPDIFSKKRTLALRGLKTFYLASIKAEDAKKMILALFRDDQQQIFIQEDANLNSLTIKSDINTLQGIERFIGRIDKPKNEVEINVEILEVNRSLINKLGLDFGASPQASLAVGQLDTKGEVDSKFKIPGKKEHIAGSAFVTLPSVALNLLESGSNNKILSKPNLRGLDGEDISFMVGDEVPIAQTQYQPFATGGINNNAVTTYQYKNVGVEIKITPFIHRNNEVTLKIKLTVNFISGYIKEFPILGKREIENKIRLKEGETNIIGGLIRDDMRASLSGLPTLARIPILGKLFGSEEKTISQTDLIFSITPKILRLTSIEKEDLEPIWSDVQELNVATAQVIEAPAAEAEVQEEAGGEGEEVVEAPEEEAPEEEQENQNPENIFLSITPSPARVPLGSETYFSISLHNATDLGQIAFAGNISGPGQCEILDMRIAASGPAEPTTAKNFSGNNFDVNYAFRRPFSAGQTMLAQLKIRFAAKGKYVLNIDNVSALNHAGNRLNIIASPGQIEVY